MRAFAWRRASRTGTPAPGVQVRRVQVNEGYKPSEVHVEAGLPIRLVFRREEIAPCSERVVFPDLGVSAELPPFQDVVIELPTCVPGEHRFCCQMDMLHGTLIVDQNPPSAMAQAICGTT